MDATRRKSTATAAALAVGAGLAGVQAARAENAVSGELPRGEFYVDVDDFRMYCQVSGAGPLLIHQTGIWTFSSVKNLAPMNEALASTSPC